MRSAVVIQHVGFEDLGTLAPILRAAGFNIRTLFAGVDSLTDLDPVAPDLLVVLGGPIGVYDTVDYPWLADEVTLIANRLTAKRATIGICLGAQLIAAASGARVMPGTHGKEIGWSRIVPTAAMRKSPVLNALFDESLKVLHWHGDTFDLPQAATHLASSEQYANQAFIIGTHAIALQFHPEVRLSVLESWYVGHAAELAQARIAIPALRAEGKLYAPVLERAADELWRSCLAFLFPAT